MHLGEGEGKQVCSKESQAGSSILGVFIWRSQGRIPVEYSSAFQCVLSGLWSVLIGQRQGRGSLVSAAGPNASHGISCLVLLLCWAWSWGFAFYLSPEIPVEELWWLMLSTC